MAPKYRWECEDCGDAVVLGTTYRPEEATVRCLQCGEPMEFDGTSTR